MDDVVARAVPGEVHEDAEPRTEAGGARGGDPARRAPSGGRPQARARPVRLGVPLPLAQRQIGDSVPGRRQTLREIAVPALRAALC